MKIIVTGALGHIGSDLIRKIFYSFKTAEIILIDSLMTQRYASLFNLPKKNKFKFYNSDINNLKLKDKFKNVDIVVHLAAITDATWSLNNKKIVEKNNFLSTKNVASACIKNKSKLILISSTSVYGTQNKTVDENCSRRELQPQSPYANTKLKEEALLKKLAKEKKLNYVILRFGTIYGVSKGMRFHTAVNKFCWQASMGEPLSVWKTALNQKRPYLDLNDASRAICFIIKKNLFDNDTYNVLTNNHSVKDIIKEIKKNIKNTKISYVNNKIMNQLSYEVLNNKFIGKGFKFNGSLKKSVKKTLKLLDGLKR
ncbi:SDR family oxidoreductase [Pelagibacteraceae bacterium]|nr:SDR family oxidoreductase [Pelagibacteraceae bacterium]